MITNKVNANLIAACFNAAQWNNVVVSPGSRNAALIKAFQFYPLIKLHSIVDERSASFYALGLAKSLNEPVGLICTSGTAVLNYSSAIAEAYYQGVPLIVMSADRPLNRINTGEGQSIVQQNVFQNFQKGFLNIVEEVINAEDVVSNINSLLNQAINGKPGPVHFNLHFSEPLYDNTDDIVKSVDGSVGRISECSFDLASQISETWKSSKKKIILCGIMLPNKTINSYLEGLSQNGDVVLIFESTSNLSAVGGVGNIDRCLAQIDDSVFDHALILTLGEHIISKKIKTAIRSARNLVHWHHNEGGVEQDTFGALQRTLTMNLEGLLEKLLDLQSKNEPNFNSIWYKAQSGTKVLHDQFLSSAIYSDFVAFDELLKEIPSNYHLQSANSSVIRYIQLFNYNQWITCHANRGTSGIDGSTSTAIGFASGVKEPTLLITGDISFLYDSNGLWNNYIRSDFRIIVMNNAGGGIFRIIPGPSTVDNFETLFETNHSIDIRPICEAYGFDFFRADNLTNLSQELEHFYAPSKSPKILEVITPRELNADVLKEYFRFLKQG